MSTTARNVLIIVAIAAAVAFVPSVSRGTGVLQYFLYLVFLGSLGLGGWRLYLENRVTLFSLGDRNRAILYASVAGIALMIIGTNRLWESGPGTLVWFLLMGAGIGGLIAVWRAYREY